MLLSRPAIGLSQRRAYLPRPADACQRKGGWHPRCQPPRRLISCEKGYGIFALEAADMMASFCLPVMSPAFFH